MKQTKIVIEIREGSVHKLYSNKPVKYVIVNHDNKEKIPRVSLPLEPEALANSLYTLYAGGDKKRTKIREGLKLLNF